MGEDEILCGCGYMYDRTQTDYKCPMCGCLEYQLCEHDSK